MLTWERFGFVRDPFCPNKPNPDFFLYEDLGAKVAEIISKGEREAVCILGPPGMGKTTFLEWLAFLLEEQKITTVFIPGALIKYIDVREKVEKAISGLRKPKLVILLDDADLVPEELQEEVFSFLLLPKGKISVVFTSKVPPEDLEFFRNHPDVYVRVFKLEKPPKDVIVRMIEKRIATAGGRGLDPFTVEEVSGAIEKAETVREILVSLEKMLERKAGIGGA